MDQTCLNCNKLLVDQDVVKAVVLTHYIGLKSKVTYALSKPFACLKVEHENCNWPQGMPEA